MITNMRRKMPVWLHLGQFPKPATWIWLIPVTLLVLPLAHGSDSVPADAAAIAPDLAPQSCRFVAAYTRSREIRALPQPLQSAGSMLYDCNHGLIWHTREPVPGFVVYTKSGTHFRIEGTRVQTLNDLVNLEMATLLLAMLGGEYSELSRQFDIARDTGRVILAPRQATTARFLSQITIVREEDGAVITLVDGENQHTVIDMEPEQALPELNTDRCSTALDEAELACQALLFPGRVAAGLTTDR